MRKKEICWNCGDDYIPNRRGVQKYCSNSCRSRSWLLKQIRIKAPVPNNNLKSKLPVVKKVAKIETMSVAGVGNATAGAALAEIGKSLFTPIQNKPATKKDIQELKALINGGRYLPVNNANNDSYGRKPFYDVETGNVVYL